MAVIEGRVVGYQLSTAYPDGIHLARLATWPTARQRGIGTALVEALIARFPRRAVTVNTQVSNNAARRIYERLGFEQQETLTPVWRLCLQPEATSALRSETAVPG
jgi:ribosomal protein S18 acetylase RimI-like enzyme